MTSRLPDDEDDWYDIDATRLLTADEAADINLLILIDGIDIDNYWYWLLIDVRSGLLIVRSGLLIDVRSGIIIVRSGLLIDVSVWIIDWCRGIICIKGTHNL